MKIITFNTYGVPQSFAREIRFNLLGEQLSKLEADVILLQEVIFNRDKKILEKYLLPRGYNFLPISHRIFNGGGLLVISKFPIIESKFIKFNDQGAWISQQITDRIIGKGMLFLKINFENHIFNFMNTHLVTYYRCKKEYLHIGKELEQLIEEIKNIPVEESIILGGDLNFDNKHPFYKKTIQELNLTDGCGNDERTFKNQKKDYILYRNLPFKNVSSKIIFKEKINYQDRNYQISDHYGIEMRCN